MAKVLVSFIGTGNHKGREYPNVSTAGYQFIEYTLPNGSKERTTIFGSALLKYLNRSEKIVDTWLIMGTRQSIWCDLVEMFNDERKEDILSNDEIRKLAFTLKDEAVNDFKLGTRNSSISQEQLNEWQAVLSNNLGGTKVKCRLVGDATDSDSQENIFNSLLDVINNGDKIVFDVTHGLRNQPIITSFVLMYLRYLKKIRIEDIKFYYGALDSQYGKTGTVHSLDFCNELMKATEAVAIHEQTGNYVQIGKQITKDRSFSDRLKHLVFAEEMHRLKKDVANRLKDALPHEGSALTMSLVPKLKESLSWSDEQSQSDRLKIKAEDLFDKGQYYKAIGTLFEAIMVAYCIRKKVSDLDNYHERENAKKELRNYYKNRNTTPERYSNFDNFVDLRNAILHGSFPHNRSVSEAVNDLAKFKVIFDDGLAIYGEITRMDTENIH